MARYAVDEDHLISAAEADPKKIYWCVECFGPVKMRRGANRARHFYHIKTASSCRLHSKSEDHGRAQLELQLKFPPGTIQTERPFLDICRVADACWETEKIVFEIQCSLLTEKEVEMRIQDYRKVGYEVIWLLDDKEYNKRVIRPGEDLLRKHCCYYLSIRTNCPSHYYDQFEILQSGKRIKKGRPTEIYLNSIYSMPFEPLDEQLPNQILELIKHSRCYVAGDRMHRALRSASSLTGAKIMDYWKKLEIEAAKKPNRYKLWFEKFISQPYINWLDNRLKKLH